MLEYVDLGLPGLNHVPVSGTPVRLSRTPGEVVSPPPRVGEHNLEVYGGLLGYSDHRLAGLKAKGVI